MATITLSPKTAAPACPDRPHLTISESDGLPLAHVPSDSLWDLVDYLSIQRIAVSYAFHGPDFVVRFLRTNAPTAQRLLNEWAASHM